MNILLIDHYAGSPEMGMEFRPYYMAREWVKLGHNVTIIAGNYSHLRIKNPVVQRDFQEETIDDIRYVWVKTGEYDGNGSARAFTMFRFVKKLRSHADTIAREWKPAVVIASSTYPLDTYAAQKIARLSGAKLIHEVHDMWPATLYEIGGMSKSHPFVVMMQVAENSAYKNSDKVVSLLGGAKDYMVEHGLASEKFVHISNGVVEEEWAHPYNLPDEHGEVLGKLRDEGQFIVGYFGGHALSNALDGLLDVAALMRDRNDMAFVLVGKGVEKENLQERAREEELENVFFLPPIDKRCVPSLLPYFDCTFIGSNQSDLYKYGMSLNKLFDSMMGGVPVVIAINTPDNPVEDFQCGISIEPGDAQLGVSAIEMLAAMEPSDREAMGARGRNAVLANYTYSVLAKRFLDVMS